MRRILSTGTILVLTALFASPFADAQGPSPGTDHMPYVEYVAALEEFSAASSATTAELGPAASVADVVAAYQRSLGLVRVDQRRLAVVVPEPCYASAHEEVLAYRDRAIALIEEQLPRMAEAETLADILRLMEAIDVELHARHPSAYVEGPEASLGADGRVRNILAALATCETGTGPGDEELAPSTEDGQRATAGDPSPWSPPMPPPWFGGRVELPELGAAITLPEGWLGLDLGEDIDRQVEAVITALGEGVPGFVVTPEDARLALDEVETWARQHEEWGFLAFSAEEEVCGVALLPRSWSLHDPDMRSMVDTLYRDGDCFSGYDGMDLLGLPAGWAIVVRVDNVCELQQQTLYSIVSGNRAGEVRCRASARPDDDWLSIAEAFEFLPEEE